MSGEWPSGEGEMAARIRAFDWSATPLGPIDGWSRSLRTTLDICLGSGFATFVLWGPELIQLYNEPAAGVLRARHPQLLGTPAAESGRDVWSEVGPSIGEVLATGRPVTRPDLPLRPARGRDPEAAYFTCAFSPLREETGALAGVMAVAIETTAQKEAARRQAMLMAELQHRTRNLLGVIRSIARRTAESSTDLEGFLTHFDGRLSAITRSQTALTRNNEVSAALDALILEEFLAAAAAEQVTLDGPEVQLSGKLAELIALAMHELVTNALKYGALTTPNGHVYVTWEAPARDGQPVLALEWREAGVRVIDAKPLHVGFGRRLLEKALPYELGAQTTLQFAPGGVRVAIVVPLPPAEETWRAANFG